MSQSEFIPNSFQVPNAYVDRFMAFLTPTEWMVLSYIARRIFGFNKRQDNIAYRQIMNGIKSRDGEQLDHGTGLGADAVESAVKSLKEFGLLIQVAPNDPKTNHGPLWALQLDSSLVKLDALNDRRNAQRQKRNQQTTKARSTPKKEKATLLEPPPSVDGEGGSNNHGEGGSNNLHNNQGNTVRKTESEHQKMFGALASICVLDPKLKGGQIGKIASQLIKAEYTIQDMEWFGKWWKIKDFRGREGKPPTLAQVVDTIAQAKADAPKARREPIYEKVWENGQLVGMREITQEDG